MTQTRQLESTPKRFPLSYAQDMWCQEPSAFDPLFTITKALRITGRVDEDALQAALDDVVDRHEVLRTVIVRDVRPAYQQVQPPASAPLFVRQFPPTPLEHRDEVIRQLLVEADLYPVDPDRPPVLRADLVRFDDRDSVLVLATHHTSSDAWSLHLIVRDLAAFYTARTTGRPAGLPPIRQYLDYTAWQQVNLAGEFADEAFGYWREQLRDARIFALPTDRPIPAEHQSLHSGHNFIVDAEVMSAADELARALRGSTFMVVLAAFAVLANQLTGTTEPVVDTMIHGRGQPEFHDTVGPFLNFLPLRTDLDGCVSFRDVVRRTRTACFQAYSHEIPSHLIERDSPHYMDNLRDPNQCPVVFGFFQSPLELEITPIAEGGYGIRRLVSAESQIPGGAAWTMGATPAGEMFGCIQYNTEEFDDRTIQDWARRYARLLAAAVADPDREWNRLLPDRMA
jgi:hypothetical protein